MTEVVEDYGTRCGGVMGWINCPMGYPEWQVLCPTTRIEFTSDMIEGEGWPFLRRAFAEMNGRSESDIDRDVQTIMALEDEMNLYDQDEYWHGFDKIYPGHFSPADTLGSALSTASNQLGRHLTVAEHKDTVAKVIAPLRAHVAGKAAKASAIRSRRAEFASARPAVVLAMLDRGDAHICCQSGCLEVEDLTIDHVVPLSRGGTDDISNLRFMCRAHNSAKGARDDVSRGGLSLVGERGPELFDLPSGSVVRANSLMTVEFWDPL